MPTYDYECGKCGHRFELFHGISDERPKRCPKCRARARRVPTAGAGLLFKGSGFYVTDYRSESYKEKAKQEKAAKPEAAAGGGGEAGKSAGGAAPPAKSPASAKPSRRKGSGAE